AEEEQEDVENIEKYPRRQGDCLVGASPAEAIEVDDGVETEDRKPGQRPSGVNRGDPDEDQHDPGSEQRQQQYEGDPVKEREIAAHRVPPGSERRNEECRGPE